MNYTGTLLSVFLAPIVFTSYGQSLDDQKIQELKESWSQKAQELSVLGEKIAQKYRLMKGIALDVNEYWDGLCSDLKGQEKKDYKEALCTSLEEEFGRNLLQAFVEKVDLKGFLKKEIFAPTKNFLEFNKANFGMLTMVFEKSLLANLIENYEICLQELAEIDHELVVSLGHSLLFE